MLKDIEIKSDDDYFAYPAISASQIKTYDKSPYEFWRTSPFNPEKQPDAETDELVFGGLAHCLLLEPKEAQNRYVIANFGQSRRNKKYKAIKAKNPGKIVINQDEWNHATAMLANLRSHPEVKKIVTGATAELPIVWHNQENDVDCKAKIDAIKRTNQGIVLIDYKTSSDIDSVVKWPEKLQYPLQAVHYCEAVREKYGEYPIEFVFIIQSNKPGYEDVIAVCNIEQETFEAAQDIWASHLYNISHKIKAFEETKDKHIFAAYPERVYMRYSNWYLNRGND